VILHDNLHPYIDPECPECPVCGLSWTRAAYARACCIPGLEAHRRGLRASEGMSRILKDRCGGDAYIHDLQLLRTALLKAKGKLTWAQFTHRLDSYNGIFGTIMKQNRARWITPVVYEVLVRALGEDPPGTFYYPNTLSAPVGDVPEELR